jgi:curli biogenesis system outer membrane secretion channel CsgG
MACCIALVGCAPGMVTGRADNARLIQGPPIQDITTPFDTALSCLSGKIPEGATFAVGVIADNTGKEQYADSGTGKMVTQGAGDMVQSSLFQAGVRVVNRRDPNIPIAESNWGLRNMGDQTAADFFISGSINSLDYIPGGGASVRIAGVGPEYRQTRILIGMDLALTNAFNGEVIANIPLQKQIYADETGLSSGRFFGNTLVDIDAGAMQREALHHALRQMLSYATLDLLAQVIDPATAQDCMSRINSADAQLMQLPVRRAKGPKRPSLQAMIAEAAAAPAVMPAPPAGAAPAGAPAPQQAAPTVEVQPNSPEATRLANEATTYAARAIAAAEESVRSETYDHAAGLVNNALSFVQLAVKSLREAAASGLSGPAGDAAATLVQQAALAAQEAQKLVLARPDAPPPAPPAAAAAPAPAGSAPPPVTPEDKRLGGAGQ